jgi:hypothetical protein
MNCCLSENSRRNAILMLAFGILWRIWLTINKLVFQEEITDRDTAFVLVLHRSYGIVAKDS